MLPAPRTSVVIPAYNHERFIGDALASVQAQTDRDFEVVVVDDGSIDGTAEVARAAARADDRIRVLTQRNLGSHAAINRGISESRGDWIAILNSDDRFAPTRLDRLQAIGAGGARFVVSDARLIDDAGNEIADPDHWWHRTMADFHARCDELGPIEGLMYGNFTVSTSNFFFARSLFDAVGPFRPLRRVLDWEWALRAAMHPGSAFRRLAGERLLDYRLHGGNAILGDPLRGIVEIGRVHRGVLAALGTPAALLSSIQRNRRELRRGWRDREVSRVERFVREREAEAVGLRAEASRLHGDAVRLQAHIAVLRARLDTIEGSLPWRVLSRLKRLVRATKG